MVNDRVMSEHRAVRKHAAQHDLFNRLHSIAADEEFVRRVGSSWYNKRFEVRCGNWYCDPTSSSNAYAYFKSTDGHMFHWDFNLRRSNLSLASYAEAKGGLILVDSTRRGKRMPDGLSKTVPIWCAVINVAISLRHDVPQNWDTNIYLPPQIVPPTERSQIETRLQAWAESLERSSLPLPHLTKPLRPFFIHPSTSLPPFIPETPNYIPIICLSASRWVNEGRDEIPSVTNIGQRKVGFEYVPGGGDDDELWARGLEPLLFHQHKKYLLSVERDDLPALVDRLVKSADPAAGISTSPVNCDLSSSELTGVPSPNSFMALDIGPPSMKASWSLSPSEVLRIVQVEKYPKNIPFLLAVYPSERVLAVPSAKTGGKSYAIALRELVDYVKTVCIEQSKPIVLRPGKAADFQKAIAVGDNAQAIDPAAIKITSPSSLAESRKIILPLALVILCAFPGISEYSTRSRPIEGSLSKDLVTNKLHGLVALWPDGNPPRVALKRVNEFLMGEARRDD
uniref:tRNA '-O-ribosylphosphate transferase n=1 Tax=Cryptococcus bacillisporus CA1280 TaxID=1296109 RepID=A0A0D0TIJ2_CRYGA|nr:tRNA '-O-ribosylphosphate transferase [Cryptococcus bacillisporus CA1280]